MKKRYEKNKNGQTVSVLNRKNRPSKQGRFFEKNSVFIGVFFLKPLTERIRYVIIILVKAGFSLFLRKKNEIFSDKKRSLLKKSTDKKTEV